MWAQNWAHKRIEMQCDQLMSMYAKHDGRLDMPKCKLIVLQAYHDTDKVQSTTTSADSEKFKDKSKVTILAWLAQMHKYLTARQVPNVEWVIIASTYLETNVAQHWTYWQWSSEWIRKIRYSRTISRMHSSLPIAV